MIYTFNPFLWGCVWCGLCYTSLHLCLTRWFWRHLSLQTVRPGAGSCFAIHSRNTLYLKPGTVWAHLHILTPKFFMLKAFDAVLKWLYPQCICVVSPSRLGWNQPGATSGKLCARGFLHVTGSENSGSKVAWGLAWALGVSGDVIFPPTQSFSYWRNKYVPTLQNLYSACFGDQREM